MRVRDKKIKPRPHKKVVRGDLFEDSDSDIENVLEVDRVSRDVVYVIDSSDDREYTVGYLRKNHVIQG